MYFKMENHTDMQITTVVANLLFKMSRETLRSYIIQETHTLAVGCKSESMKLEVLSVGPQFPETVGLSAKLGL